jgi:hypothetical protein
MAPDGLARLGMERDRRAHRAPETRTKPLFRVRSEIGWDGTKRISRPPRSAASAPLQPSARAGDPRSIAARSADPGRSARPHHFGTTHLVIILRLGMAAAGPPSPAPGPDGAHPAQAEQTPRGDASLTSSPGRNQMSTSALCCRETAQDGGLRRLRSPGRSQVGCCPTFCTRDQL